MSVCSVSSLVQTFATAVMLMVAPHSLPAHAPVRLFVGSLPAASQTVRIHAHGITVMSDSSAKADVETLAVVGGGSRHGGLLVVKADSDDRVRVCADVHVGPDEHAGGDVVAVFGSARIEGQVDGSVIAVFGSVQLGPNAVVGHDAVSVGGGLDRADGARVSGDTVQVGLPLHLFGLPSFAAVLALLTLMWLSGVLLAWLPVVVFPVRVARAAVTASRRTACLAAHRPVRRPGDRRGRRRPHVHRARHPDRHRAPAREPRAAVGGVCSPRRTCSAASSFGAIRRRPAGLGVVAAGSLFVTSAFGLAAILWALPGVMRIVLVFLLLVGALLLGLLSSVGSGAWLLSGFGRYPEDVGPAAPLPSPAAAPAPPPVASA
jgi:hypothetical protein